MSGKRSKFQPKNFEKIGSSNLSVTIYKSMIESYPWKQLTPQAKVLYMYMKLQQYGQKPLEGYPDDTFYFNRAMYVDTYGLYVSWRQFGRDLKLLVKYGFIKVVERGKNMRSKNVYQFSCEWQNIKSASDLNKKPHTVKEPKNSQCEQCEPDGGAEQKNISDGI